MKRAVIILFLNILGNYLVAQNSIKFNKTYFILPGYGVVPLSIMRLSNDYLVYASTVYAPGRQCAGLAKIDSLGDMVWVKTYPFAGYNEVSTNTENETAVTVPWGGEIAADILQNDSTGFYNWALYRFDSRGDTIWTKNNKDSSNLWVDQIKITRDNKYLIYGQWIKSSGYPTQVALIKTDTLGSKIWQKTYRGNNTCIIATGVDICKDGGFIFSAYQYDSLYYCSGTITVIKTDSLGNVQWKKTINSSSPCETEPIGIVALQHGGYAVCGFYDDSIRNGLGGLYSVLYLLKLSSSGTTIWSKEYINPTIAWEGSKALFSLRELPNGDLVTCGIGGDSISIGCILKVDSNGNQKLMQYYTNPSSPISDEFYLTDIQLTGDGGFISSGFTYGDTSKIWVVKTDSLGVYTGLEELRTKSDEVRVYPNPSTGQFNIVVSDKEQGVSEMQIEVYNVLGEKVYQQTVQSDKTEINLGNQPNGMYFYRAVTNTGTLIGEGKMMIER